MQEFNFLGLQSTTCIPKKSLKGHIQKQICLIDCFEMSKFMKVMNLDLKCHYMQILLMFIMNKQCWQKVIFLILTQCGNLSLMLIDHNL